MSNTIDPLLPLIVAGRPMHFNNLHRAKMIVEAPRSELHATALAMIEFAQAEALQRRTWEDERVRIGHEPT
jgi:hypothetical protein